MTNIPKCGQNHPDCFALDEKNKCICLDNTDFNGRDCPFYKSEKRQRAENPDWFVKYKFVDIGKRSGKGGRKLFGKGNDA